MKLRTYGFLSMLLFIANNPAEEDRPFEGARVLRFSQAFIDALERFIDAFVDHIDKNGFPVGLFNDSWPGFGGDLYLTLSGDADGFADNPDDRLRPLHQMALDWADGAVFQELVPNLQWNKNGEIDIVYDPEDAPFVHGKVFDFEKTRLEVEE